MKRHFTMGVLLVIFACLAGFSQETLLNAKPVLKPLLFASVPTKSACNSVELQKVIRLNKSESISLKLNDNLVLSGKVLENVISDHGVRNVNVLISNFGNALLNISFLTQPDNTIRITGRMIDPNRGDALVISEENGKYYITKFKMEFFMVE